MRTQWTTKGNRDAGSSCLCDRGLHRYLRNFGGWGFEPPKPPLDTPLPCLELNQLFFLFFLSVFSSLFIHLFIHLFIRLFFLNCIRLQCTAWSLIFILHPPSTHRSVFSFYFEMCYIAPLNVRRTGEQSVVEERRPSVNTRTPAYANILCKIRCSKIFCLRCVSNDNKLLAPNKYFFLLEMLALAYLFAILYIHVYIYIYTHTHTHIYIYIYISVPCEI